MGTWAHGCTGAGIGPLARRGLVWGAGRPLRDAQLAARLSPSAAMRNVLVHVYLEVDYDRVADAVPLTVEWYGEYVRQVAAWMREHEPGD